MRRVQSRVDGDLLDAAIGAWSGSRLPTPEPGDVSPAVAVDGKSVAGTFGRVGVCV